MAIFDYEWHSLTENVSTALAVGAGGGCLSIFTLIYPFSFLSPSLWETTRYRLKYCLKGSLSPKTTNQPTTVALPLLQSLVPSQCNVLILCFLIRSFDELEVLHVSHIIYMCLSSTA